MNDEAIEAAARAIMIARSGQCLVTDWREADRNPAVAEVLQAARAAAPALMEEGARLALEAAKRDHIDWYRLLKRIHKEHGRGMSDIAHGIVATFDALDPAAIVKGAGEQ